MPKVIIDTHKMLPPFPFMVWNSSAVYRVLQHHQFDLNEPYKKTRLNEHTIEYTQGETHAPQESETTSGSRCRACGET